MDTRNKTEKKGLVVGGEGGDQGEALTKIRAHTWLCIINILLARLDERLIEVEDILWQRLESRKRDKMRESGDAERRE